MLKGRVNLASTLSPLMLDRLATSDEIRAAMLPFPDPIEEYAGQLLREIAADVGGFVRLSVLEIGTSLLVEELTQDQAESAN